MLNEKQGTLEPCIFSSELIERRKNHVSKWRKDVNPLHFIVGFFNNDRFKSEWLVYL